MTPFWGGDDYFIEDTLNVCGTLPHRKQGKHRIILCFWKPSHHFNHWCLGNGCVGDTQDDTEQLRQHLIILDGTDKQIKILSFPCRHNHILFHFCSLENNNRYWAQKELKQFVRVFLRQEHNFNHDWVLKNGDIQSEVKVIELWSISYHLLCSFWSCLETLPGAETGLEGATNSLGPWKHHRLTRTHIGVAGFHNGSSSL